MSEWKAERAKEEEQLRGTRAGGRVSGQCSSGM